MKKIKEIIVVEGVHDCQVLESFFDCETLITGGNHLKKETIKLIRELNETRGVIVFTDPDHQGEMIRKRLNEAIPNLKNAFLQKEDCRFKHKVGIEHASKDILEAALNNLITYANSNNESISSSEFISLGLNGDDAARQRRNYLSKAFHLGEVNAKTCLKRLRLLNKTYQDCKEVLDGYDRNQN